MFPCIVSFRTALYPNIYSKWTSVGTVTLWPPSFEYHNLSACEKKKDTGFLSENSLIHTPIIYVKNKLYHE